MIPVSFCIIAKDEEKHIEKCIQNLIINFAEYPHEIVILDTGSADRTKELAARYTDKVYDYVWVQDFSKAKNESIRRASNDWVFIVDCDEYMEDVDMAEFCKLMASPLENGIGTFRRRDASIQGNIRSISVEMCPRLFSRKNYEYSGRVHEQLVAINDQHVKIFFDIPVVFYHEGYLEMPEVKGNRNIELLMEELYDKGDDPYVLYQLGKSYDMINDSKGALKYYERALEFDLDPKLGYVRNLVEAYGHCLMRLGRHKEAMCLEGVYSEFAVRADFHFLMGHIYMNNGLFERAVNEFEKAARSNVYREEGVNGYKAYYNIGVIYECTGQKADAITYYKKCGCYKEALERLRYLE